MARSVGIAPPVSIHDGLGRIQTSTQTTAGVAYPFSYQYSLADQLTEIQYPSGRRVAYVPDSAGRVQFVRNGVTSANYATMNYTLAGGVSTMALGNGLTETWTWNDRLQATNLSIAPAAGAAPLQLSLYPCDGHAVSCSSGNTGDLRAQVITTPDLVVTQTFGYDSVGRLSTAAETPGASGQGTPTWSRGFGYDAKSNMWVSSDPGAAIPPLSPFTPTVSTNFDAQNRLLLQSAAYQNAGHQQAIGGFTSAFDAEGRMVSSTGTMSATYDYDGQGQRVRRKTVEPLVSGGHRDITTVYVYDATGNLAAEYESVTEYDQAGTPSPGTNPMSGAANPCGTSTCYVSVDQLGSTRMVTDSTGTVKRRYDYLPFGEEIATGIGGRAALMGYQANGDGFNPKFTGQVRDLESRLDYFNARYYSPEQGRFVSPDPGNAGADPAVPQTWNGYAYVGNNPVNLVDPSGLGFFDFLGNFVHNVLVAASGGLWGVVTSAIEGHAPPPSFAGLPGVDSLLSCGGPFGNCGGIGGVWTEESTIGPSVQDPGRFIFSFQDQRRICGDFYCDQNGHLLEAIPAHMMDASDPGANMAIVSLGQSLVAPMFRFSTTVTVSRWGRAGLEGGDWVMKGAGTRWNYFWLGKWEPEWVGRLLGYRPNLPAPFSSGASYKVPASAVRWPSGLGLDGYLKGLLGQRIYKP